MMTPAKILIFPSLVLLGCNSPAKPGGPDMAMAPYNRTLTTRPLMPTSPLNLLRDPLVGGDGTNYGEFRAYFVETGTNIPLTRTFQSVSPVGGAVSVKELRDLPDPAGAKTVRTTASFLGGAGSFHATIWLSAGDVSTMPVPFASAAPSVTVTLLGSDGSVQSTLTAAAPVSFGNREWVQFETAADTTFPTGGWLSVVLSDLTVTLQLAAPEVTSSAIAP